MLTCRGALAYNLTELDISGDFNLEEGHLSALGTLPNLTELRLIGRHLTGFEKASRAGRGTSGLQSRRNAHRLRWHNLGVLTP